MVIYYMLHLFLKIITKKGNLKLKCCIIILNKMLSCIYFSAGQELNVKVFKCLNQDLKQENL